MFIADVHVHLHGDEKPERVSRTMDKAGLDTMVVIAPYRQTFMPERRVEGSHVGSVRDGNNFVAKLVKALPRRLRGYAFVTGLGDIRDNVEEVERAVQDLGLHGVKLFPNLGWYPDDAKILPLYEKISDLDVPILFHSGIVPWISDIHGHGPLLSKYSRPAYYEAVVRSFPKLRIILAHMSWPWYKEAVTVAYLTENIYLDICTDFTTATRRTKLAALKFALESLGPRKILYASDSLATDATSLSARLRDTLNLLSELKVGEKDVERIMGDNARRLFNL
jgi:predicted TIM-barrel fold metal-dependent hydrolase